MGTTSVNSMKKKFISVVIPSYRRPAFLKIALDSLVEQDRLPDQVVVGLREGDEETLGFLREWHTDLFPVETSFTSETGVVASMNAAIAKTQGDIVCLLDDDAEPLQGWVSRIEGHFQNDDTLGAIGGRDLLQDHPEMRRTEPTVEAVGIFTWYGKIIGNHHRGGGEVRQVDIFKGCSAAIDGPLLRSLTIDRNLRGKGAQVHWELALCLDIASAGYKIIFDPDLQIIHHVAPRHDNDNIHRGFFSRDALYDIVFNESYVVASRCSVRKRVIFNLWSHLVGSSVSPGFAQFLRILKAKDRDAVAKLRTTIAARRAGVRRANQLRN